MQDLKNLEGLEIFLGYKCNVRCTFCYQKDLRLRYPVNLSFQEVEKLLVEGYAQGKRFVIFAGGEPTLDSNLISYVQLAQKLGYYHIRLHTNGFMLSQKEYMEEIYAKGLTGVIFSFHGYKESHDRVTGVSGSFSKLDRALRHASDLKQRFPDFTIDTNTVVYKGNYTYLLKLFLYLSYFPITRCQLNYCSSLELFSQQEKKELMVEYSVIIPYIKKILHVSKKRGLHIVIDNIPYCVIGENFYSFLQENIKNDRVSHLVTGETKNTYADTYNNIKTQVCQTCIKSDVCSGIPIEYFELFSDTCLKSLHE